MTSPVQIDITSKPESVGDEAILLFEKTSSLVVSSNNRVSSTKYIDSMEKNKIDYIIHDDGLQHYHLFRDYEIVVSRIKKERNNFFIPCGPIREPAILHSDANYVFSNNMKNNVPGFYTKISRVRSAIGNELFKLTDNRFRKATLMTAIASDINLVNELQTNNIEVSQLSFEDHYQFKQRDIPDINKPILVTEKDFTKLRDFNLKNIYILEQKIFPNDKLMKLLENL